jgi:hypothetical protein
MANLAFHLLLWLAVALEVGGFVGISHQKGCLLRPVWLSASNAEVKSSRMILTLPDEIMTVSAAKTALNDWAREATSLSSSFRFGTNDEGVSFYFSTAPACRLDIAVSTLTDSQVSKTNTAIYSQLILVDADERVMGLVRSSSTLLIDSFSNEVFRKVETEQTPVVQTPQEEPMAVSVMGNKSLLDEDDAKFSQYQEALDAQNAAQMKSESSHRSVNGGDAQAGPVPQPERSTNKYANRPFGERRATADPELDARALAEGIDLQAFEGRGLEEQAVEQLNEMLETSKRRGFYEVVLAAQNQTATTFAAPGSVFATTGSVFDQKRQGQESESSATDVLDVGFEVDQLFERGMVQAEENWKSLLDRADPTGDEDLDTPVATLPIVLPQGSTDGVIDIFEGPDSFSAKGIAGADKDASSITPGVPPRSSIAGQQRALSPPDLSSLPGDKQQLTFLVKELIRAPEDMKRTVLDANKDLLLSSNIAFLLREQSLALDPAQGDEGAAAAQACRLISERSAELYGELGALVELESVRHLQTIHDVCECAVRYKDDPLAFVDALDTLKPQFDMDFLGYLDFAIAEEQATLIAPGDSSSWLQLLRLMQAGVHAEFAARYDRLLEPVILMLRFEEANQRSALFKAIVDSTPPLDLLHLRALVLNMVQGIRSHDLNKSLLSDPDLPERIEQVVAVSVLV